MVHTRFLTPADVEEILNVSRGQVYSLVRGGDLPAIQIGGRGVWRIEQAELEAYIARQYDLARRKYRTTDPPTSPTGAAKD
ncbi:helix-turn-helix domain-containing protein [Cellulomonas sp. ATA003]|uniref:helix-turn-helix domain-containing protein n=1 Tax=Cellulomonas sp. ATA003 TaxID=3073064 RepID=UPI00287336D2|nr:helix-turn-helix domain-containing protein [Cellulomonas sp. ATA003]WNB86447.1 helix-turn-helix domain-containing protein [Cellulomonas sp. ATA003]